MIGHRFDALARGMASGASRRTLLGLVAALPFQGALAAAPAGERRAASGAILGGGGRRKPRHRPGDRKRKRQRRRKDGAAGGGAPKTAALGWPCSDAVPCGAGQDCLKPTPVLLTGFCTPTGPGGDCAVLTEGCDPNGRACCGDLECRIVPRGEYVCVPPARPVGARCSRGAQCQGGRCRHERCRCRDGLTACDAECVDSQTDPRHCGRCGNACDEGEFCFEGACSVGGGAGWGWGGNACSFPAGPGFCWGMPLFAFVTRKWIAVRERKRRGVSCELKTDRYRCPLCAPYGDAGRCGDLDDPTPEQLTQHCEHLEIGKWEIVSCHESQCEGGEILCDHRCRAVDPLCPPPERGSFVPSVQVCTSNPGRDCGERGAQP